MARRRQKKSKSWIWGLFIVFIMVFSGLGYMLSDNNGGPTGYNGYKITQMQNGWLAQIEDYQVAFDYHPTDIEDLEVDESAVDLLKDSLTFYVSYDPNSFIIGDIEVSRVRLQQEMSKIGIAVIPGIMNRTGIYQNFQQIDCSNSTKYTPVVIIEESNTTAITSSGNCIYVKTRDRFDLPAMTDRLVYGLYGVI